MALIERMLGLEQPKIPVHSFQAIVSEWARGQLTGLQAQAAIEASSGAPLSAAEITEAQALVATVPTGVTTANKADRALRLQEIDQVLLMVDQRLPPYDDPVVVRVRLGL